LFVEEMYDIGYYLLVIAGFGYGLEFVALKLGKEIDKNIIRSFLTSWEFGFTIMAIVIMFDFAPIYVRDFLLFVGAGIAIPDLPVALKKYYKYTSAIAILIKLAVPGWLGTFIDEILKVSKELKEQNDNIIIEGGDSDGNSGNDQ